MTERPNNGSNENPKGAMNGFFGSLLLALVLSNLVGFLIRWAGGSGELARFVDVAVFFGIIFSNPVGTYLDQGSPKDALRRFLVGAFGGMVVARLISLGVPDVAPNEGPSESPQAAETGEEQDSNAVFLKMLFFMFLIMPVMFLLPTLDRYLKGRSNPEVAASHDLQISVVFPLYLMLSMGLTFFVMGALWFLNATVLVGLGLLMVVVLLAITEVWTAEDGELPDLENETWSDRPENAQAAWEGLRKAIRPTVTSSLFLGTTMYLSLKAALPYLTFEAGGGQVEALSLITGLLAGTGIMLVGFVVIFALCVALIAALTLLLARTKGADPLSMAELARQAQARLLMGGITHVRPDQLDD